MKRGKKYNNSAQNLDRSKLYTVEEAIPLLKKLHYTGFDESVDIDIRLNVDPRNAEQQVRGTVVLPHGTGKTVKILVFAKGEKIKEAEDAGADFVGADDLIKKIAEGWLGFDIAVATPDMMRDVSKLGKTLGPRGLMPNPKAGTVTFDLETTVKELKAGKVEYRVDRYGIVHSSVGKLSMSDESLLENTTTLLDVIWKAKPAAVRGQYIKNITISGTMTPGIKIAYSSI